MMLFKNLPLVTASVLLLSSFEWSALAEESRLKLLLGGKAGTYQTSGNLFSEKDLRGWGMTIKLIPESFGQPAAVDDDSFLADTGIMVSFDIDNLSGKAKDAARFPFQSGEDIQLVWSVLMIHGCAFTQSIAQVCVGLPASNALYLEQNLGGETWNSFSITSSGLPIFLSVLTQRKELHFGVQLSSSSWDPTYAGVKTHFRLLQSQVFIGYAF